MSPLMRNNIEEMEKLKRYLEMFELICFCVFLVPNIFGSFKEYILINILSKGYFYHVLSFEGNNEDVEYNK